MTQPLVARADEATLSLHGLLVSHGVACRLFERLAPARLSDGSVVLRLDLTEADLDAVFEQAEDAADYRLAGAQEALTAPPIFSPKALARPVEG